MEEGEVVEVNGSNVLIATEPSTMCAHCSAAGRCGFDEKSRRRLIWARCSIELHPGEKVQFNPGASPLFLSSIIYLVPLFLFACGVLVFVTLKPFADGDLNGAAGGVIGLGAAAILLFIINQRYAKKINAEVISKKD